MRSLDDRSIFIQLQNNLEVGIIKQFQFSSSLQRMSVIVQATDDTPCTVFCKGSPEMIASLSKPTSVPDDFQANLLEFTKQGYRVLALGMKELEVHDVEKLHREDIESDLDFIGLIVLENKLKPETNGVIYTLKNANLKVVMITG